MENEPILIFTLISTAVHILGILSAFHSIMHTRTSQGAIAWSIALVTFPYVTIPLYWIISRNKFFGYIQAFRSRNKKIKHIAHDLKKYLPEFIVDLDESAGGLKAILGLAELPPTGKNSIELLIDGAAAFDEMFKGIETAKDYIVAQFYIIEDDELGREFRAKLIGAKERGVSVYMLYDEIGSYSLSGSYLDPFLEAGIETSPFKTAKGKSNRFQINFRNHRKILIIDGKTAFVGGLNIGDEYISRGSDKTLMPWRDTHLRVEGPAVQCVQVSFIEDWYWATDKVPQLNWHPVASESGDLKTLVLSTGPADDFETCDLFFVSAINSAKNRIWIASPYFVPDPQMVCALQLAALRGVDVRIIAPKNPDKKIIWLSAFSFFEEVLPAGVKVYLYEEGFMHQKAMLIDNETASVGTANFDNRSFRWNFEITMVVADSDFAGQVEKMLIDDLNRSRELTMEDIQSRSFMFKLNMRITRLFSQIL